MASNFKAALHTPSITTVTEADLNKIFSGEQYSSLLSISNISSQQDKDLKCMSFSSIIDLIKDRLDPSHSAFYGNSCVQMDNLTGIYLSPDKSSLKINGNFTYNVLPQYIMDGFQVRFMLRYIPNYDYPDVVIYRYNTNALDKNNSENNVILECLNKAGVSTKSVPLIRTTINSGVMQLNRVHRSELLINEYYTLTYHSIYNTDYINVISNFLSGSPYFELSSVNGR